MDGKGRSGVREALEQVFEAVSRVLGALLEPYEALAQAAPDAPLGEPVAVPARAAPSSAGALAEAVEKGGRNGWALHQVRQRERQVDELVQDYRRGRYRSLPAADWVGKVRQFQDAVLSDLRTAMQAPRGWDRIDLVDPANSHGRARSLLTAKEVAAELRLDEREVRRRIQAGRLGPWRKESGRWVIDRDAFLAHFEAQVDDADLPGGAPRDPTAAQARERLLHLRIRPHGEGGRDR